MATWPEAGWYFEPGGPQIARWWDGSAWGPYAPPVVPTPQPAIDGFGLPAAPTAPQYPPAQQVALIDPTEQVWVPPGGVQVTTRPRTGLVVLITLIVIAGLLILIVPAIDVSSRERHRTQAAGQPAPGSTPSANPPLVVTHETGGTQLKAHGFGSWSSTRFLVLGHVGSDGTMPVVGGFTADSTTTFTLIWTESVPNPNAVLTQTVTGGSGGLVLRLPSPGSYTLVVETDGAWTVDFTTT